MKSICIVSDSHGRIDNIRKILDVANSCEYLIFLGDCAGDIYRLRHEIKTNVITVRGNCDLLCDYPEQEILDWCGHRFFITHGNRYRVKSELLSITYAAKENNCDYVLFGHTHMACVEESNGVTLINPGSIAQPRMGECTYCMVSEEKGNIFTKIISL